MISRDTIRRLFARSMMIVTGFVLLLVALRVLEPDAVTLDTPVYWGVGRGLLNGLHLYRDIFEVKPPGIFLLSALSFRLFGTGFAGNLLTAAFLLGLPAVTGLVVRGRARSLGVVERSELAAFAFTGTAALVTYAVLRANFWQTEVFGAAFGMTFVLLIAFGRKTSVLQMMLAGVALLGAVVFKEPFALSCLGAALLLVRVREWKRIVVPFAVAGAGFIVVLLMLGAFSGYVHDYPVVMHQLLDHTTRLPMIARGMLAVPWIVLRFTDISPLLLVAVDVCMLLPVLIVAVRKEGWSRAGIPALRAFLFGLAAVFLIAYVQPFVYSLRNYLRSDVSHVLAQQLDTVSGASFAIIFLAVPAIVVSVLLFLFHSFTVVRRAHIARHDIVRVCIAGFLAATAVGLAGSFWPSHFVFAIPFYFAALLACTKALETADSRIRRIVPFLCLIHVLALVSMRGLPQVFHDLRAPASSVVSVNEAAAATVDKVLDACGEDQYLTLSAANNRWIFQYTKHSPANFYIFKDLNKEMEMGTFLEAKAWERLRSADVLIDAPDARKLSSFDAAIKTYIDEHFTTKPWVCAAAFPVPDEYVLLFRTGRH